MPANELRPKATRWPKLAAGVGLSALVVALAVLFGGVSALEFPPRTWTFQEADGELAALGFRFSPPEGGEWQLTDHEGATGNRALVNLAGQPGATPASAVVSNSLTRDLKASTRCKPAGERPDQSCGLVFRYLDHANHYVAQVDTARGVVALGVVLGGVERELAAVPSEIAPTAWQELAVVVVAEHLGVWLNGQRVLNVLDPILARPGRVGIWAPSSGQSYFDEFSFAPLPAARAHPSDLLPIVLRKKT